MTARPPVPDRKGRAVTTFADLAHQLTDLLGLTTAPVAVVFDAAAPSDGQSPPVPQPAGCCFWAPARRRRIDTVAADHANCSVGSYTHGLIPLDLAAAGADTAALVGSGWVSEPDLMAAAALPFKPTSISYQPLAQADRADIVLIALSPAALMTLMSAAPDLHLAGKPQCVIVPLAHAGEVAVSPGCAVSRTRTGLPADELTAALPASRLAEIVERLHVSTAADHAVSAFAAADMAENFA